MKKVARMLPNHRSLLLNWFRAKGQLSGGAVEGFNNRLEAQGCGRWREKITGNLTDGRDRHREFQLWVGLASTPRSTEILTKGPLKNNFAELAPSFASDSVAPD